MNIKRNFLLYLLIGISVYIGNAQTPKTNSIEIVNDSLKAILDKSFGAFQNETIIFIKVKKIDKNEYELKISCDGMILLKYEYNNDELIGFFKYKNATGIVYGKKTNIFFKKIGKMNIPDYYLQVIKNLNISLNSVNSDLPPIRYDGSVFYYKYKNGRIIFDRSEWAKIL